VQGTLIGVGSALRKARLLRGLTLREASRGTRIRAELLEALERERFGDLPGEVYVRGALRSYSSYLGLDPEKVVDAYATALDREAPSPPPPAQVEEVVRAGARRRDHVFAVLAVLTALGVAAALGFLSRSNSAPEPAVMPSEPTVRAAPDRRIVVALTARRDVRVRVTADAAPPETFVLRPGEARSFEAELTLRVSVDDGGAVELVVAGRDLGVPGRDGHPWRRTFSYEPEGTAAQAPPGTSGA
jgi:hypothetical protein